MRPSVTIERSAAAPDGDEVNVESSLDANYTHQLDVVLDSVVQHCSRPVRAFLLCRGLDPAHFERTAELFPPSRSSGSYRRRRLRPHRRHECVGDARDDGPDDLPALLKDVGRIVHFDLDALCLGDLAELFTVEIEGHAIAGATAQPRFRLRIRHHPPQCHTAAEKGAPGAGARTLLRTHKMRRFDFDVFDAGIVLLDLDRMRADDFCRAGILPNV